MRRPNLSYQVSRWGDRDAVLLHDATLQQGQGLVYVQSRHDSERWSQRLQASGLAAASFHAGLPAKEKQRRQQRWMSGQLQVLACTSAFGMGIDAPHVRWVFHAGPPPTSNLTSKKQDGQDGMANPASCILYVEDSDFDVLQGSIERQFPALKQIQAAYQWAANASHATYGEQPEAPFPVTEPKHLPALRLLSLAGHLICVNAEMPVPKWHHHMAGFTRERVLGPALGRRWPDGLSVKRHPSPWTWTSRSLPTSSTVHMPWPHLRPQRKCAWTLKPLTPWGGWIGSPLLNALN